MMTCGGSRLPAVKIIRTSRLKRQLYFEMAKASIEEIHRVRITDGMVMTAVFQK